MIARADQVFTSARSDFPGPSLSLAALLDTVKQIEAAKSTPDVHAFLLLDSDRWVLDQFPVRRSPAGGLCNANQFAGVPVYVETAADLINRFWQIVGTYEAPPGGKPMPLVKLIVTSQTPTELVNRAKFAGLSLCHL